MENRRQELKRFISPRGSTYEQEFQRKEQKTQKKIQEKQPKLKDTTFQTKRTE